MAICLESPVHAACVNMLQGCGSRSSAVLRGTASTTASLGIGSERIHHQSSQSRRRERYTARSGQEDSSTNYLWGAPGTSTQCAGARCFHREVVMHSSDWDTVFQPQLWWLGKHGIERRLSFSKPESISHILGSVYAMKIQELNRECLKWIKIDLRESHYQLIFLVVRKERNLLKNHWAAHRLEGKAKQSGQGRADTRAARVSCPGAGRLPRMLLPLQRPTTPGCLHKVPIPRRQSVSGPASVICPQLGWGQRHNKVTWDGERAFPQGGEDEQKRKNSLPTTMPNSFLYLINWLPDSPLIFPLTLELTKWLSQILSNLISFKNSWVRFCLYSPFRDEKIVSKKRRHLHRTEIQILQVQTPSSFHYITPFPLN